MTARSAATAAANWGKRLWEYYEDSVYKLLRTMPNAVVEPKQELNGRKFDFLVTIPLRIPFSSYFQAVFSFRIGGDCKQHNRPIDVKAVDSFVGMLGDAGLQAGIMVSEKGFTSRAVSRAKKAGIEPLTIPWDIASLLEDDKLPDYVCSACDPGPDHSPPIVFWFSGYDSGEEDLSWGFIKGGCSWCSTPYAYCLDCGGITGFVEPQYGKGVACKGDCGRVYVVTVEGKESATCYRSYDALQTSVISTCRAKKSGLRREDVEKLIGRTKWQYWTMGDPLMPLLEEGVCRWTNSGRLALTPRGKAVYHKYVVDAEDAMFDW